MRQDRYPNFIIIGAAKAGTTSLAAMLGNHPEVFLSTPKEPHYFSHGWQSRRKEYESLFAGRQETFKGEASTTYTHGPEAGPVPHRIHATIPDVRLIYLLRNPLERIRSQYVHRVDRGTEHREIERAVREDPRYIEHTKYARRFEEYLEFFPRSQLLVLANDSLRRDPQGITKGVLTFIGADPDDLDSISVAELNRSVDKRRSVPLLRPIRIWARRHSVLRFLSPRSRTLIHRIFSRPIDREKASISPELASYIWAELESDQALLRTLVEPTFPTWMPDKA